MLNNASNNATIKSRIILISAAVVLGLGLLGVGILLGGRMQTANNGLVNKGSGFQETDTRQAVPEGTKAPEVGEQVSDNNIAVPIAVTGVVPGSDKKVRTYDITANGGVFAPSTIIGNQGDTIHINFTAVDKDYDITFPDYSMKQTAKKGEKKILEFQAQNEGKFVYYCESCGGINSSAKGFIIVAK